MGVMLNQHQPWELVGVHAQHRTMNARVFVRTIRPVWPVAVAERHLPAPEVLLELRPLGGRWLAVLLGGTRSSSTGHVSLDVSDDRIVVRGYITLGRVQI